MSTHRDHLDAETVAAWIDGGLDSASLAAAEAHASNCQRCQALLATVVKTEPDAKPGVAPGFSRGIWKWWMAPIAATAAAVTLWMVVPQERVQQIATAPPAPAATVPAASPPAAPAEAPAEPARARDELASSEVKRQGEKALGVQQSNRVAQTKPDAAAKVAEADSAGARDRRDTKEERLARVEAEPTPVAEAAPAARGALAARAAQDAPAAPGAPAAPAAQGAPAAPGAPGAPAAAFAPLVTISPDPRFRWRASAAGIERSEDSGRTWFIVRLPQGEVVTAGASPAPLVCWLVGRRGLVLIATDGTNFTPLPFPERVDLVAVTSPDVRVASVTTADGRVFHTDNAGRNWRLQP